VKWLLPLVVVLLLLSGCGGSGEPQTVSAVASAYRQWDDSGISGKIDVACSRMTDAFVKSSIAFAHSKAKDCRAYMKETYAYAKAHPEIKNYTLSGITVKGDRATLIDQTPFGDETDTAKMTLVRTNGRWMVDTQTDVQQNSPKIAPPPGLTS
jgi:hypothetical protein